MPPKGYSMSMNMHKSFRNFVSLFFWYAIERRLLKAQLFFCITLLCTSTVNAEENLASYPEVGIAVSGIPHLSVGYWWEQKGVRLSGMYLGDEKNELHLNLAYAFSDEESVQHSINLLTSWVVGNDPGADYEYAATGVTYSINYEGLFLEIGLGWPWKDAIGNVSDNFVPMGYLGYIHRFNRK